MTTPRTRSIVSLATALTLTLALGGCASAPSRLGLNDPAPIDGAPLAIHFDNGARDYVHVYLVGAKREWLLGRVEPGARTSLRIPDEALGEDLGFLRLAVLTVCLVVLALFAAKRARVAGLAWVASAAGRK